jgi:hypothetical protein
LLIGMEKGELQAWQFDNAVRLVRDASPEERNGLELQEVDEALRKAIASRG